jgi:uncharacterized protein YndB with AHSA1/START domain
MTPRSVVHATFTVDRTYPFPPETVFAAFTTAEAKRRWFAGPEGWETRRYTLDFRPGGVEEWTGAPKGGSPVIDYDSRYQDVIPNERIITTYEMHIDGKRISVSVATFEFRRAGKGTRLVVTEQGAFLDGLDKPDQREQGTRELLEALGKALAG